MHERRNVAHRHNRHTSIHTSYTETLRGQNAELMNVKSTVLREMTNSNNRCTINHSLCKNNSAQLCYTRSRYSDGEKKGDYKS